MQVFLVVVGASGSILNLIKTAPSIFIFALVQVTIHLIVLGLGKLFKLDLKLLLLASNANIGGPTTACGMAKAKGWESLVVPGILTGWYGIHEATNSKFDNKMVLLFSMIFVRDCLVVALMQKLVVALNAIVL
ncbi:uncharacterized membrane protein YjcL-like [Trifolium pratense]|uniref:uncharacterized membrane protein YjcL-like n=1 Tax=Trifolium pratense TaxID=57577 RepID=UPI001E6980CB|nr:uncharacterized membrane protein YjcL-like [Trifolium pratense]